MIPDANPPALLPRNFSFAQEFYSVLRGAQATVLWGYQKAFPNPLAVSEEELEKAGLSGDGQRGGTVTGPQGEGRLVGRHPMSGAPVVAWTVGAYEAMCVSFDAEHVMRIELWQNGVRPLMMSTATCTRWANRADLALRWNTALVALGGSASLSGVFIATGVPLPIAVFTAISGAVMVGLPLLLFFALGSMLGITALAGLTGAIVGAMASRRSRQAIASDEAGRLTAMDILETMQGEESAPRPEAEAGSLEQS